MREASGVAGTATTATARAATMAVSNLPIPPCASLWTVLLNFSERQRLNPVRTEMPPTRWTLMRWMQGKATRTVRMMTVSGQFPLAFLASATRRTRSLIPDVCRWRRLRWRSRTSCRSPGGRL